MSMLGEAEPQNVGQLLDTLPSADVALAKPAITFSVHAPGIYFGMPEEEYLADRSLSASGIKDIHVTPLTYWMQSGFNPNRKGKSSDALGRGKAFHARLLEGADAFASRYAVEPQISDFPEAIDGGADLKARCKELGLPASGTIAELCKRIRDKDPEAVLWPDIMAEFEAEVEAAGQTIIKAKLADEIERMVHIVEMHPGTEKALRGGYCEVSIFYIDPETGVPLKARIDYLKARAAVEQKTFSNPFGKQIDAAVASSMANNKYMVDAAVRLDAVEQAKAMYRKHGSKIVHGRAPPKEWMEAFANPQPHAFVFLFLEAGDVPNVLVREYRERETPRGAKPGEQNLYWQKGLAMYRQGVELYRRHLEHYGPDLPWVDPQPMRPFFDSDFPLYALE